MRNPLLRSLLALLAVCFSCVAGATHYMGWDIRYQYLGNDDYQFTITLYRDVTSGDVQAIAQDNPIALRLFNMDNNGAVNSDVPGAGVQLLPVNTLSGCIQDTNTYGVSAIKFVKTLHLPANIAGYVLASQRCCLPTNISTIPSPGSYGMTLSANVPGNNLHNNSAVFSLNDPQLRFCIHMPFEMDYSATDPDGDSLAYRLVPVSTGASPNDAKPTIFGLPAVADTLQYYPTYSSQVPMGSNAMFSLNPATGKVTGVCHMTGYYIVAVACDEYRNGTKINTVVRVFSPLVRDCHRDVVAAAYSDSLLHQVTGNDSLVAVQCANNTTVHFANHSTGAVNGYHWDFGDNATAQDTSSLANPQYTYPGAGTYPVTLVAYGQSCNDTMKGYVVISSDSVTAGFMAPASACIYDTIQLQDNSVSSGSAITQYAWVADGTVYQGNPLNFYFIHPGQQDVQHYVTTAGGCVAAVTQTINVQQATISAGNDTTVVMGTQLYLQAGGGVSYAWSALGFNANLLYNSNTANPYLYCNLTGVFNYLVIGTDEAGCKGVDTVRVTVTPSAYVSVPTAFTPNGDGRNDVLKAFTSGCNLVEFAVYDRYGRRVFVTSDYGTGWDGTNKGTQQPMAAYIWVIKAKDRVGAPVTQTGSVMLVR